MVCLLFCLLVCLFVWFGCLVRRLRLAACASSLPLRLPSHALPHADPSAVLAQMWAGRRRMEARHSRRRTSAADPSPGDAGLSCHLQRRRAGGVDAAHRRSASARAEATSAGRDGAKRRPIGTNGFGRESVDWGRSAGVGTCSRCTPGCTSSTDGCVRCALWPCSAVLRSTRSTGRSAVVS